MNQNISGASLSSSGSIEHNFLTKSEKILNFDLNLATTGLSQPYYFHRIFFQTNIFVNYRNQRTFHYFSKVTVVLELLDFGICRLMLLLVILLLYSDCVSGERRSDRPELAERAAREVDSAFAA